MRRNNELISHYVETSLESPTQSTINKLASGQRHLIIVQIDSSML